MTLKNLGNTDFSISPIGLGTWAIGGDWSFGWGPQDDTASIAAIQRALDRGINWIDTAPVYGLGHAEKLVAKVLKALGSARRPFVFTKCGLIWDAEKNVGHSLKADSIRAEVEASLRRLETDVLDLCQIHWPSFPPGSPAPDLEEAWQTLTDLISEGKIRQVGVSNFSLAQLERLQKISPIASHQPPYSALMRAVEGDVLPFCEKQNIGVIVYSPMHNGLLSGKMTRERIDALPASDWRKKVNPAFKEPYLSRNLAFVEILREIGKRHDRSPGEVAIAWTLRLPSVTGAIVGARDAAQVDGFAAAMDFRLNESEIAEIQRHLPKSIGMMSVR